MVRVQGANKGQQINLRKVNLFKGMSSTFLMEVTFSTFFWLPYHNLFNIIKESFFEEGEVAKAAMATGILSGAFSVMLSHPFDVIRTVKIVDDDKFGNLGNIKLIKKIYEIHGLNGVFSGKILKLFYFRIWGEICERNDRSDFMEYFF